MDQQGRLRFPSTPQRKRILAGQVASDTWFFLVLTKMQGRIEQQFTGRDGRKRGLLDLGVSREALLAGKVGLDGGGAAADLA